MKMKKHYESQPISTLGYLGYEFLYAIPVIGLLICFVNALGAKNRNVRSFSRAQLVAGVFFVGLAVTLRKLGLSKDK